ncbi:MAG: DUF4230 domain-containing protein [Phycisphaera sp.]|nr:DUF4230 domain-containing protein [Phycisphaera sp.]
MPTRYALFILLVWVMIFLVLSQTLPGQTFADKPPGAGVNIGDVLKVAQLATLRVSMSQAVEGKIAGYTGGVSAVILASGEAVLGVDIENVEVDLDEARKTVRVTLPEPKVLSCALDINKTHVTYIGRSRLWALMPGEAGEAQLIARTFAQAQERLRAVASATEHVTAAREQTERALRRIVEGRGWRLEIVWCM